MTIEPFDALAERLKDLRPSATIAASQRRATNPREALDMFVESLGFQTIGKAWRQLDKDQANGILKRALEYDLAFNTAVMESEQAAALADDCLDLAGAAEYFTNGSFGESGWSGGHKVAPGTFEIGVAWVGPAHIELLWVEDED